MPRFSIPSLPALALAGSAFISAMSAIACSAQAQVPPQMRREAMTLMQICRGDYDRLCAGVQPGGGRVLACLHEHANQLSADCSKAMPRADALKNSAAAAGALPK
ncbi:MAG: cysteine rich repeat-containing protein [Bradyrhizobium sp.]